MMRSKRRALRAAAAAQTPLRFAATLRAQADAAGGPKWNQLFPMGTFHNGGWPAGGVTIDAAFCAAMVENWKKRGEPELAVDYFHKTNEEDAPNAERVASGWMQKLEARDDGLYALIKWTDKARAAILADELRYLSPEFHPNGMDARTGKPQGPTLVCAGLLTNPAFKEMPRVAANEAPPPEASNPVVEEHLMNKKQMLALLAKFNVTTVTDASTDAEVIAAFEKQMETTAKASADAAAALKAKETSDATAKANEEALKAQLVGKDGEVAKLTAGLSALTASVAEMKAKEVAAGTERLCARLVSEHRIVAAAQDSVKKLVTSIGLEEASKFYDTFPKGAIAPGTEQGHGNAVDDADNETVKAAAAELVEKSKGTLAGSAAIRAAAMANPAVVRKLAAVPSADRPRDDAS